MTGVDSQSIRSFLSESQPALLASLQDTVLRLRDASQKEFDCAHLRITPKGKIQKDYPFVLMAQLGTGTQKQEERRF